MQELEAASIIEALLAEEPVVEAAEIEAARAMLGLTVRMAEEKRACHEMTCRNLRTAALNMLCVLDAAVRGEVPK